MKKEEIENIFRYSNNSNELFDAFQSALSQKIEEVELYKALLGNPTLSPPEIEMYTEKLCSEFKDERFDIYSWTARLFETKYYRVESIEKALHYYAKAAKIKPEEYLPFINVMNLYNYDFDLSFNKIIIDFVKRNLDGVKNKREVYKSLAEHYKKLGDNLSHQKYLRLIENYNKGLN